MKDGLIFYISQYEAIKSLTDEQLGRLYRAIFEKQLGNEVVLEDDIKIAFNFINNQMVVDNKKYMKKVETLRNNGKKGGAPLGNHNAKKQQNNQNNQIEKKTTLNEKEKEKDNVKDIKKENIKRKKKFFENENLNNIFEEFLQVRKKLKAVNSDRAIKMLINKLSSYDDETKMQMIEQSIVHSWKDVYEIKTKKADVPSWFNQELKEKELTDEQKRMYDELMGNN